MDPRIRLERGDITRVPVDAIVNAANSALAGGGGVDGAIHRAGGPSLMQELDGIREREGGCPTGSAVVTRAGKLPARFVFHAVGPVYRDGRHSEPELLASCYRTCLKLAEEKEARSISFPAISTGIYGYPADQAAEIAVREVEAFLQNSKALDSVVFVVFDGGAEKVYRRLLGSTS
ncbi:MAG TPA: O-acetyl-ADP-ribose deacetylase [Bryobacteraceae bacterium]|jgi:O-acetyl-ADP-ribose deacetylase (regulator of RNase III)